MTDKSNSMNAQNDGGNHADKPNSGTAPSSQPNVADVSLDRVLSKLPVSGLIEKEPLADTGIASKPTPPHRPPSVKEKEL
jgi:hypothetical protein